MSAAFLTHLNEACVFQDLQVVGDRLLAGPAALGDGADRQGLVAYEAEDLLALGSSKRCEHVFGWHPHMVAVTSRTHKSWLVQSMHK